MDGIGSPWALYEMFNEYLPACFSRLYHQGEKDGMCVVLVERKTACVCCVLVTLEQHCAVQIFKSPPDNECDPSSLQFHALSTRVSSSGEVK
jgi:hypothetical protein